MSENIASKKKPIAVTAKELPLSCPPKDQAHWNLHPRVYLTFENSSTADCPYCGNQFMLKAE